jgi:hypothetical protein
LRSALPRMGGSQLLRGLHVELEVAAEPVSRPTTIHLENLSPS